MERMKIDPKEAGEKAQGMIEDAKGKVQDVVKNVTAEVQGRYEAARDTIEEFRDKEWTEILDDATDFVTQHPLPMIFGALVLGYGLGRLFGSRD